MTAITIGQLAERSGVATSAIRFYESRGLIASERTTGNQRRYAQSTLRRVAFIKTAQRIGLTPRGDRRGAGDAPRPAYADQGRLAPAQPRLAAAARRPDPAHRAAARPARRLHRLRLPQPQVLRPHQPRRRPGRPRPRRRAARPRQAALVIESQPSLAWSRQAVRFQPQSAQDRSTTDPATSLEPWRCGSSRAGRTRRS